MTARAPSSRPLGRDHRPRRPRAGGPATAPRSAASRTWSGRPWSRTEVSRGLRDLGSRVRIATRAARRPSGPASWLMAVMPHRARTRAMARPRGPPQMPRKRKTGGHPGLPLRLRSHSGSARSPHMPRPRTVAAWRTEDQPLTEGLGRRAPAEPDARLRSAGSAAPRASARRRYGVCGAGACGRWRCRWSVHLLRLERDVAGIARRPRRSRPSRAGSSCRRCWVEFVERAAALRPGMIVSRRARTRSSATCSGSGTRRAPGDSRARWSSWSRGWRP